MDVAARSIEHLRVEEGPDNIKGVSSVAAFRYVYYAYAYESGDGLVWTTRVDNVTHAGVSLAIVWGAMAERAKLWVYFAFGVCFTLIYSVTSHSRLFARPRRLWDGEPWPSARTRASASGGGGRSRVGRKAGG